MCLILLGLDLFHTTLCPQGSQLTAHHSLSMHDPRLNLVLMLLSQTSAIFVTAWMR